MPRGASGGQELVRERARRAEGAVGALHAILDVDLGEGERRTLDGFTSCVEIEVDADDTGGGELDGEEVLLAVAGLAQRELELLDLVVGGERAHQRSRAAVEPL